MSQDWEFTATGTVVEVERMDIDKSGRAQKFSNLIRVRHDSQQGAPTGARIPEVVGFRVLDRDMLALQVQLPASGDRVRAIGIGNGPAPAEFALKRLENLPPAR